MDPKRGCWRNQAQTNTGAHTQVLTKGKSSCNEDPTDCCSLTKPLLHRWSLGWTIGLLLWPGDGTALHIVGMCFMYAVNWNSYCSSGKVVSFVHTRHWKALHPPLTDDKPPLMSPSPFPPELANQIQYSIIRDLQQGESWENGKTLYSHCKKVITFNSDCCTSKIFCYISGWLTTFNFVLCQLCFQYL